LSNGRGTLKHSSKSSRPGGAPGGNLTHTDRFLRGIGLTYTSPQGCSLRCDRFTVLLLVFGLVVSNVAHSVSIAFVGKFAAWVTIPAAITIAVKVFRKRKQ
jgi:hypothetical protein